MVIVVHSGLIIVDINFKIFFKSALICATPIISRNKNVEFPSKKSAEKIVRKFRGTAEIKKSHRQAGIDRQSSKSKYRFYYLIRL